MGRKATHRQVRRRTSLHVTLDEDLGARLRAFSGYHGRDVSDVVAEGVKAVLRGFRVSQERPGGSPAAEGQGVAQAVGDDAGAGPSNETERTIAARFARSA